MTAASYTSSQRAHAQVLLSRSHTWVRGTRKSDGLTFIIFESSRKTRDGQMVGYYSTATACTCPGYFHRGACSHQLAVATEADLVPAGWTAISREEQEADERFKARLRLEAEQPRRAAGGDHGTVAAF